MNSDCTSDTDSETCEQLSRWAFVNNTTGEVNTIDCPWSDHPLANGLEDYLPDKIRACFEAIIILNDWNPNDTIIAISEDEDMMTYHQYIDDKVEAYDFLSPVRRAELLNELQSSFDDDIELTLTIEEIFDQAETGIEYEGDEEEEEEEDEYYEEDCCFEEDEEEEEEEEEE